MGKNTRRKQCKMPKLPTKGDVSKLLSPRTLDPVKKLKYSQTRWRALKERIFFFYELIMLTGFNAVGVAIIIGAFPFQMKAGAAIALWGMARAIRRHLEKKN